MCIMEYSAINKNLHYVSTHFPVMSSSILKQRQMKITIFLLKSQYSISEKKSDEDWSSREILEVKTPYSM
jgi:hypothetical protein